MKRILVVGGAGYVGSMLVRRLLDEGYVVRVFDQLVYGDVGLQGVMQEIELQVGDLRMLEPSTLDNVDAVINLGGISNDPTAEYDPEATFSVNRDAAVRLAKMCREQGIRSHILASSCSVYDVGSVDEEADVLQVESASVNPVHPYSKSKHEAEQAILAMSGDGFCPVVLRKGTVYGFSYRMRYDLVVNTFVRSALETGRLQLFSGGETWRPLADLKDVVEAYVQCLRADKGDICGEIFNIASGNLRISELGLRVQAALDELGIPTKLQPSWDSPPQRNYRVSTRKARNTLGVQASRSIGDAVKEITIRVQSEGYDDFDNPRYYNIRWRELAESCRSASTFDDIINKRLRDR
jgi:nucleoside-diphosphate-sugar epimerase